MDNTGCTDHPHREAYCLMRYRSDDGKVERTIWNSRNGVTPFVVTVNDGTKLTHVDWQNDKPAPLHVPKLGDIVFVDLTLEKAIEARRRFVERHWDHPDLDMRDRWESKENAARELAKSDMEFGGGCKQPHLEVVDAELREAFAARSQQYHFVVELSRQLPRRFA